MNDKSGLNKLPEKKPFGADRGGGAERDSQFVRRIDYDALHDFAVKQAEELEQLREKLEEAETAYGEVMEAIGEMSLGVGLPKVFVVEGLDGEARAISPKHAKPFYNAIYRNLERTDIGEWVHHKIHQAQPEDIEHCNRRRREAEGRARQAEREAERLRHLLRKVEWCATWEAVGDACPCCGATMECGHADGCVLKEALGETDGEAG